jgi:hypothetical protein
MRLKRPLRPLAALGVLALAAALASCGNLDVENPNAPDRQRALSDPAAIEAVAGGAMRTWLNAYTSLRGAGVLATQARSYSSSWNNGNLNFYSSVDNPSAAPDQWVRMTRTWQNDPAAGARTSIEAFWGGGLDEQTRVRGGFYNSLSAANDALRAIRGDNPVVFPNASAQKRVEAFGLFMQGASLAMLSLQYDKAYIVDETTDLSTPAAVAALQYSARDAVRDSAVSKLEQAATVAAANAFTTPDGWTGSGGFTYSNSDIAKMSKTLAAMTLAWYPRDSTEIDEVDWAKVAQLASGGMSSGTPVDLKFEQDGYVFWISELMNWFDGIDGGRMHTRMSHFMDPATQMDPWPLTGNPQPNSPDKRLGDGSFGDSTTLEAEFGTPVATANAGSDYAWSEVGAIMRPDRGSYHQSNIAQIRYDESHVMSGDGQYAGFGPAPAINATVNDLLWAEALIRLGGATNLAQAATLIDKTRVGRGGLSSSATAVANVGADANGPCMANNKLASTGGTCTLMSMLLYEYEVELPGLGPAIFWVHRKLPDIIGGGWAGDNSPRRHIAGLLPGTPREMPVPAKELGIKGEPFYTWGGSTPKSPTP